MLRTRAIRSLLVEEVAGLRLPPPTGAEDGAPDSAAPSEAPAAAPDAPPPPAELERDDQLEALGRAERRALWAVGVDWAALVVLFLWRDPGSPFLPVSAGVETVFTLGVVAIAVHSGFRLGQLEKIRAVRRAWEKMLE